MEFLREEGWLWTWFWSKEKNFIRCLTRSFNTLYIFGKCEFVIDCLIDLVWLWESWNYLLYLLSLLTNFSLIGKLILIIMVRDCIQSTLVKNCLGVLGGVLLKYLSVSWKRKVFILEEVGWWFWTKSSSSYLADIILDCLSLWWKYSVSYEDIGHI